MVCCSLMSKDHHEQPTSHPHDSHHLHRAHPGISPYHWTSGKLFSALQATTWPMAWWWLQTKNNRRSIIGYHWQHFLTPAAPYQPILSQPSLWRTSHHPASFHWMVGLPRPPWMWPANQNAGSNCPRHPWWCHWQDLQKYLLFIALSLAPFWHRNKDSHSFDKIFKLAGCANAL